MQCMTKGVRPRAHVYHILLRDYGQRRGGRTMIPMVTCARFANVNALKAPPQVINWPSHVYHEILLDLDSILSKKHERWEHIAFLEEPSDTPNN